MGVGERPQILPPGLAPTLAPAGLRPPTGFLSEEEFYREKQRLQSINRK